MKYEISCWCDKVGGWVYQLIFIETQELSEYQSIKF